MMLGRLFAIKPNVFFHSNFEIGEFYYILRNASSNGQRGRLIGSSDPDIFDQGQETTGNPCGRVERGVIRLVPS